MSDHVLTAVAWPYANGPRHIGHVAGFGVPSDVFSRYQRMAGNKVLMVSGTDEHGTPILVQADKEEVSPRDLADRYSRVIAEDLRKLGLSYDLFTRTTTRNHYAVTQEIFLGLLKNDYVFARKQLGAISPSTGRTLPDRYIEGTCPICGYPNARGDQCDNCGNQLDPTDLINPRSRINGETPRFAETDQYFLDLPAFTATLGDWLAGQKHWRPNVRKFAVNLLDDLKPRAITRDLDWGVPVPLDGWRDRTDKRLYVWFDAVIGYLSASIEWAARTGDPDAWRPFWQSHGCPRLLLHGQGQHRLPRRDLAGDPVRLLGSSARGAGHRARTAPSSAHTRSCRASSSQMEGRKFSSSRNVVIYVGDMLSRYDPDALRYYLTVAGPENQDTDFTWAEFLRRNNDELVAGWGNLVNRTVSMTAKNIGSIPAPGTLTDVDRALLSSTQAAFGTVGGLLARSRQKAAITEVMRGRRRGQQVPVRHRAVGAAEHRPRPDGHRAAHRVAGRRRLQDVAHPVPAVIVLAGACVARRHRRMGPHARTGRGRRADRRGHALVRGADRPLRHGCDLGIGAARGRTADRPADPGVHQARPVHRRRGAGPPRERRMNQPASRRLVRPSAGPAPGGSSKS